MAVDKSQLRSRSASTRTLDEVGSLRPKQTVLAQAVSMALIAAVAPAPLLAQTLELEEIIVTATKRAESVMDVPLSITAMSGEAIREVNLNDIKDLITFTPGITGNSKDSFLDFVSVRGIRTIDFGNGGDPSVSLYKNGLYQGRTGSGVSSLFDIERAEVLRGPQGFLFGRNSVSGAMNIITAKPNVEQSEGFAEVDAGERGVLVFEGAVNVPAGENLAFRVAGYHSEEDGYVENLAGGPDLIFHDKDALRLTSRYQTDRLTADLMFEYEDRDQYGTVYRATGEGNAFEVHHTNINGGVPVEVPADGRNVNNDNSLPPTDVAEIFSVGLFIDYEMDWATFTSITGYKDHDYSYVEDFDASPLILFNYGQDQTGDYFEQEFRLTSKSDGPLSWYAGVSFYNEDIDTTFLGQMAEDAYCVGYWGYYANYAVNYYNYYYAAGLEPVTTCQGVFDYYNGVGQFSDYGYGPAYAYYLDSYLGGYTFTPSADGLMSDRNRIIGKYEGYSAYVDLSYEFSETFDVSLGLRYSYDEKDFSQEVLEDPGGTQIPYRVQTGFSTPNGPLRDKQDWDEVTWRVVGNWRPNDDSLVFGSITTGYKPGGFGSFNIEGPTCDPFIWGFCVGTPGVDRPGDFGPETVTSYEVGYKGTVDDGRMQLAVTAFLYDYEDMQAIFTEGLRVIVDNVGQVDGMGIEFEMATALGENFNLRLGGSWFDSEATNVQAFCGAGAYLTIVDPDDPDDEGDPNVCEGNSIPWAPEFTAFAVLNADFPAGNGEIFGNLAWSWEKDYRGDWPDKNLIFQRIAALDQTDIVVGYRQNNWRISAYVENVFDNVWYDCNYGDDPSFTNIYAQHAFGPSRPRTAGVRFGIDF